MTNAKVKRKNLLWKFRLHSAFIPLPHTLLSPSRSHSCDSPLPAPAFLLRRGMLLFLADLFLRCSRILFELDDDVCFVIVWPASAQQKTKEKTKPIPCSRVCPSFQRWRRRRRKMSTRRQKCLHSPARRLAATKRTCFLFTDLLISSSNGT